jgi:hypothetical protein
VPAQITLGCGLAAGNDFPHHPAKAVEGEAASFPSLALTVEGFLYSATTLITLEDDDFFDGFGKA